MDTEKIQEITGDLYMNENRIKGLRNLQAANDAVTKIYMNKQIEYKTNDLEDKIHALQQLLDGTKPLSSNLDMGNNKIINAAHPRNPEDDFENERHMVTAEFLYDYINIVDRKFLKANEDNILDGRLNMKQHKTIDLADPLDNYDAVTKRYVSSRIQALVEGDVEMRISIGILERQQQTFQYLVTQFLNRQ